MSAHRYARPLLFLLAALPSLAQTTAGLRVQVLDAAGKPVAGSRIVLGALDRAGQHVLVSDSSGVAVASGLLPGRYRLQGQLVTLHADQRLAITLRGGAAGALVSVEALGAESSSVAPQTALDKAELLRLPVAHRYVEHSYLAPGITPSGKPEPVVLGSMLDANAYLVDGMPTNLSSTGRFGLNLSSEILESQTITTGGHKAEVGFASGGVFSSVTRTGTDVVQGSLYGSRIARSLNRKPAPGKTNSPEERPTDASEWGFSLGGPVLKDRLYFFAAAERQLQQLDYENVTPPGGAPHRRTQVEDRQYRFAKLTWLVTAQHRLELSYFGDPVTQGNFDTAGDSTIKDEQLPDRTRGGNSYLLKHVGVVAPTVTWESTLGLHRTAFQWNPATPGAGPNRAQLDAPGAEGFGRYAEDRLDQIRNLSLRSEVTALFGAHQLKGGFQGLQAEYTVGYRRPSGGESYVDRAAGGAGPKAADLAAISAGLLSLQGSDYGYRNSDSLTTPSPVTGLLVGGRASYLYQRTLADQATYGQPLRQKLAGVFLQDDWKAVPGWTLNLGLRLDRASVAGEDGRRLYAQTLLSPRLGVSWETGLTKVFVYGGRIYSPPSPGNLAGAGATTGGPATRSQVWIPTLNDWKTWRQTGTQGVKNVAVGNLRAPHTDLFQLGLERTQALPGLGTWALKGVLTRKRVRDLIDTYNPAWGYLPELNAAANQSAAKKLIANLPGLKRDFQGFDLVASRAFQDGHRLQFSYSHGELRGNSEVGNVASSTGKTTGFAQIPGLREDYRQSQYDGLLNESVKHAFKAFGSLSLPWRLELGGAYSLRSGLRYSRLVTIAQDNVLAPGSLRGDRQLPSTGALDLALSWSLRPGRLHWRASLEVFNLFNQQPLTQINNLATAFTSGNYQQPRLFQGSLRVGF